MSAATPGQALSPDPADFAYHVRATAFNVLTGKMAGGEWHVPRSERDAIARAVVDAVEPLIRADERAAAAQEPQPAPDVELHMLVAERNQLRMALERLARDGNLEARDHLANILPSRLTEPKPAPELAPGELLNSTQERHPSREVNLLTDDHEELTS